MNLFSNNVRSLVFQYRINPRTQFSRHCHNRDARRLCRGGFSGKPNGKTL